MTSAVRVTVIAVMGSAPREPGAAMVVTASDSAGTIGGGALEHRAIGHARTLLTEGGPAGPWHRECLEFPLGPSLEQCCGGWVELAFEVQPASQHMNAAPSAALIVRPLHSGAAPRMIAARGEARDLPLAVAGTIRHMMSGREPAAFRLIEAGAERWLIEPAARPRTTLFVYGAGHVGREVVRVLSGLPFDLTWIDVAAERFPATDQPHGAPGGPAQGAGHPPCLRVVTDRPQDLARLAPQGAFHLVLTYSHALDEAITRELLALNAFGYLGLIGSRTKRARFVQRFRAAGISDAVIARLVCPIGAGLTTSKEPAMIAVAVAAELAGMLDTAGSGQALLATSRIER